MTRKSEARRASRREKMAMRWPNMKKPVRGRIPDGLEVNRELSVLSKTDEPPLAGWRRPAELALGE